MELETYISDLLYRYECVTLPEFGAFLTKSISASINRETNNFYPPKKIVSFNAQIQSNDGLLAHYMADIEKIPFETANKKIAKRVKILKSYLAQGETLSFKNIGDMVLNDEGKIAFEPTNRLNYATDAFGFSPFELPNIARDHHEEILITNQKPTPSVLTPKKRKSEFYLKYAAVAIILLTFGGLVASNYYVNQIERHNEIAHEEASKQLDKKIQQATFNLHPLPAITLNVSKQTGNYHIVAGAFRIEKNCDKKIKQLQSQGFSPRKIGANRYGLHQVVYASYKDRLEALKALSVIKTTHNREAWLLVKNLD